ncbi:hypothetical protein EsH8_VIII_000931 [Colletotrichum jinshuiense]
MGPARRSRFPPAPTSRHPESSAPKLQPRIPRHGLHHHTTAKLPSVKNPTQPVYSLRISPCHLNTPLARTPHLRPSLSPRPLIAHFPPTMNHSKHDPSPSQLAILTHLSKTLTLSPPQSSYPPSSLTGPLTSHTGTAYLFLSISSHHPCLQVHSYPAIHWARAYISNIPTPSAPPAPFEPPGPGLLSDALAGPAIRACITQDLSHVRTFLALLAPVLDLILPAATAAAADAASPTAMDTSPPDAAPPATCLLHGLAGTLYLLRIIRHWVPSSAPLVSRAIVHVSEYLLAPATPWSCPHHPAPSASRHGAAHGDLGVVTQLVLTSPPLAPRLASKLSSLLDLQLPDGDWPSAPGAEEAASPPKAPPTPETSPGARGNDTRESGAGGGGGGGGFASGAQGLVISLLSLRPFFPALQGRVDDAVARARAHLWARARDPGLSPRDPSLFHGALSTALTMPKGPERNHLLATATAAAAANTTTTTAGAAAASDAPRPPNRTASPTVAAGSVATSLDPGAAWMWAAGARDMPRMIFYNDV